MGDKNRGDFEEFVTETSLPLLRTAYLLVNDLGEAEDLVQEALLRVARSWPRIRAMDHPLAYARRVLVNKAIDQSERSRRRRQVVSLDRWPESAELPDPAAAEEFALVDVRGEVGAALAQLTARQRIAVVLRYWDGLSEAETAQHLSCSVGTVKSTTSRGLARLRELLDHNNTGDNDEDEAVSLP
ncbi:MAG TPA: SigE family RNA polymerase sigma factor [Pseudonocardiaceae bacterium]|jgi:RNA polymerase sigma-70 factor (sigma-E family)|nr:SigE family RNA polymerase sigma factor [Pseudonocardiaceae bacterium]